MPAPSYGLDAVMVLVMAGTYVWCTGRRRVALDYDRRLAEQREVMMVEAAAAQDRARAEERSRIARELHDVVAHSLTVVNVQAATALALGDPAGGRAALATIRDVSRQALAETRAVVHMLRTTETMDVSGELRTIVEVVDQVRAAGVQVECDLPDAAVLDGWQQQWPVATRLAVVRLVQESLTNVLRHGGKQASLTLGVDGSRVTLQVSNPLRADEPPHPPGFGLVGMRERVDLLGGSFAAGAVGERFLVTATIPVSQEVR
ncbi:sensor histidine kinase [Luteococcus sp.]|uniref:sensor histidine kinase n=1 Tax=Luteococcus sp. TaxID=1969402 RepID=UPI003734C0F9